MPADSPTMQCRSLSLNKMFLVAIRVAKNFFFSLHIAFQRLQHYHSHGNRKNSYTERAQSQHWFRIEICRTLPTYYYYYLIIHIMSIDFSRVNCHPKPFSLTTSDGNVISTSDFQGQWLYLVFHRHLSWLPCRAHLSQLRQQNERLVRNNIAVLVVSFEQVENVLNYQGETGIPWPVVVDTSRELYAYYGFTKAGFWDLWGFSTWVAYCKELLKGNFPRRTKGDIDQLGGDVLIDPDGLVRVHHISKGPADRPQISDVLARAETLEETHMGREELQRLKNWNIFGPSVSMSPGVNAGQIFWSGVLGF